MRQWHIYITYVHFFFFSSKILKLRAVLVSLLWTRTQQTVVSPSPPLCVNRSIHYSNNQDTTTIAITTSDHKRTTPAHTIKKGGWLAGLAYAVVTVVAAVAEDEAEGGDENSFATW